MGWLLQHIEQNVLAVKGKKVHFCDKDCSDIYSLSVIVLVRRPSIALIK